MPDSQTDRAPKQRLVGLRVGEISLVDDPANEEEFVIVKSLEGNSMATQGDDGKSGNDDKGAAGDDKGTSAGDGKGGDDKGAAGEDKVIKAIESLTDLVKAGTAKVDDGKKKATDDKATEKQLPPPLRSAMEKLMEMLNGMLGKAKATTKSVDGDDEVVEKAKRLSRKRMERMKSAVGSLLGVMKEMDEGAFGELFGKLDPSSFSDTAKAGHEDDDDDKKRLATTKALETVMEKSVEKITDGLTVMSKRLDDMEKAEGTTKSVTQDGNDKPQPAKKSFWHGVV